MSSGLMVWAGMTVLGLWAAGMTGFHLIYRRQVKRLARLSAPGGTGTSSLSKSRTATALALLKQRMAELLAARQTLEDQVQAMGISLEEKDKELIHHKEESQQMVQNARVTGKRIMKNASRTLDKGIRSTRQVIDCLDTIIRDAGRGPQISVPWSRMRPRPWKKSTHPSPR